jgi:hypothetical protein
MKDLSTTAQEPGATYTPSDPAAGTPLTIGVGSNLTSQTVTAGPKPALTPATAAKDNAGEAEPTVQEHTETTFTKSNSERPSPKKRGPYSNTKSKRKAKEGEKQQSKLKKQEEGAGTLDASIDEALLEEAAKLTTEKDDKVATDQARKGEAEDSPVQHASFRQKRLRKNK